MPKELDTWGWTEFFGYVENYNPEDIVEIIYIGNPDLQSDDPGFIIDTVLVGKLKDGEFIIITGIDNWDHDPEISEDEVKTTHTKSYVGTNLTALLEEASLSNMKLKIPN